MTLSVLFALLTGGLFALGLIYQNKTMLIFSALFGFITISAQLTEAKTEIIKEIQKMSSAR